MKRSYYFLIGGLALLAACTQTDMNDGPVPEGDAIRATARALGMNADTQTDTRAAYTAVDAKGLKALVLATQTAGDYALNTTIGTGKLYAKGTMTFDAADAEHSSVEYATAGFSGNAKLPADKSPLFLCGLYPSDGAFSGKDWSSIGATASYTFDGRQDVMAAAQTKIAKGGTGDGVSAAAGTASFAFKHLLTKLDIKVKADIPEAIDAWGVVKSITVSKVLGAASFKNTLAVTLASGTAATGSAFSGAAASWKTYAAYSGAAPDTEFTGGSVALTTAGVPAATTMLAPFTATNATTDLELTVVTKTATGSDYTSKVGVKIPAGDTQGNAYTVTLNFKVAAITGTATVGGWTLKNAGETEVN